MKSWTWFSYMHLQPKIQSHSELHQQKCGQQVKGEDSAPLLYSHEDCLQLWGLQHKKDVAIWQRGGHKEVQRAGAALGLVSLEK